MDQFKDSWDSDYDPEVHFEPLLDDIRNFAEQIYPEVQRGEVMQNVKKEFNYYISDLSQYYEAPERGSAPETSTEPEPTDLDLLFVDVDE